MKCPNCNNEIEQVDLYSECRQKCEVDKYGKITAYGNVEEILETIDIECYECGHRITDIIKSD